MPNYITNKTRRLRDIPAAVTAHRDEQSASGGDGDDRLQHVMDELTGYIGLSEDEARSYVEDFERR
jgi:hypothetical protein